MKKIVDSWYQGYPLWKLLLPLSWLFLLVAKLRRRYLQMRAKPLSVPVIVVGNITLGGTGKTPLVIALAHYLHEQGYQPGIISRGYASQAKQFPLHITQDTLVEDAGDEPWLIASHVNCPVVIDPNRVRGVEHLLSTFGCDVIISDDGLQHYRLRRTVEIIVVDAKRGLGNGQVLPAGPLREPPSRLHEVDAVVVNGGQLPAYPHSFTMQLLPEVCINLKTGEQRPLSSFTDQSVHAVAGIGHPQRFFTMLQQQGIKVEPHAFADHYTYFAEDLRFAGDGVVLMTEKDAVKCRAFAQANWWMVPVSAQLPPALFQQVHQAISAD